MPIRNPLVRMIRAGEMPDPAAVDAELLRLRECLSSIDLQLGDRTLRPASDVGPDAEAYWAWRRRAAQAKKVLQTSYSLLLEWRKAHRVAQQRDHLCRAMSLSPEEVADPVVLLRLCRRVMCRWIGAGYVRLTEDDQALLQATAAYFNPRRPRSPVDGD